MSFVTINADLTRACEYLQRIADALDRAFPIPHIPEGATTPRKGPAGPDAVGYATEESIWELEQDDQRRSRNGESPQPASLPPQPTPQVLIEEEAEQLPPLSLEALEQALEQENYPPEELDETIEIELENPSPEITPDLPSPSETK
jgi:hypothetical protein